MSYTHRLATSLLCLSSLVLLQGCAKSADTKAAAPATAAASGLKLTDPMTAYHTAGAADRSAVIPVALEKVKDEMDRKGKSDDELKAILLPCMNTVDETASADDRAKSTVLDLVAVCVVQSGFKK